MTYVPSLSSDTLQAVYDRDPALVIADATPITLTMSGAAQVGMTLTDGAATMSLLGNGAILPNGTFTLPSLRFAAASNDGLYSIAAGRVGLTLTGARRFDVSTTAVTTTVPMRTADGVVGFPAYSFTSEPSSSLYLAFAGGPAMSVLGVLSQLWTAEGHTAQGSLVAAGGSENAFDYSVTVNKAAGDYVAWGLTVTETLAPGTANSLLTLSVIAQGTGDTIGGASPAMTMIDAAGAFTSALIGGSITITGATTPANDGTFPITIFNSGTTITYTNANGVAEAFAGTYAITPATYFRVRSNGSLVVDGGTPGVPGLTLRDGGGGETDGIYSDGTGRVSISIQGLERWEFNTSQIGGAAGGAAAPAYTFRTFNDIGMWYDSSGARQRLSFSTHGAVVLQMEQLVDHASNNEVSFTYTPIIDKAAGNYTAMLINVTETSALGADNRLLDLQVGGSTYMHIDNLGQAHFRDGTGGGTSTLLVSMFGIQYGTSGDEDFQIGSGGAPIVDAGGRNVQIDGQVGGVASAAKGGNGSLIRVRSAVGGAGTGGLFAGAGGNIEVTALAGGADNGGGGGNGGNVTVTAGAATGAATDGVISLVSVGPLGWTDNGSLRITGSVQITTATATNIFTHVTTSEELYYLTVYVVGKMSTTVNVYSATLKACFKNDGGTLTQIGVDTLVGAFDGAAAAYSVATNINSVTIEVQVKQTGTDTVDWTVRGELVIQ